MYLVPLFRRVWFALRSSLFGRPSILYYPNILRFPRHAKSSKLGLNFATALSRILREFKSSWHSRKSVELSPYIDDVSQT
jgi:hypothetical protein